MSSPLREITTTSAPSCCNTCRTVSEAPPLPSTSAFLPLGSRCSRFSMAVKPAASVLSPKSVPSTRRTMVFTLPMARAASLSSAQ